ncbi:MerR family transcriptional regulator [Streptomyces kasugaensis]|uniref:MerR family transcriptional regulator n=1 Tax=Streptomyces kasugaensis TaxID=1946 RepID=A0A4Q9HL53_STRKA|nr:MerR family transcriptional regulator [Streptomyces kasugaensis]TBO55473.1 MerR family transcriptional regulator [Streptomyces kasugaensis]
MFTIGDFARYGRVSARMLRHYDAIGLLRPARTDPASGYRYYAGGQLTRLNRIIALKELGFTLQQVAAILDEQVSAAELRGMLRLRQAELAAALAAAGARLAQVETRLRTIESEGHMPADDVVLKRTETVLVAELSGVAASYEPEDIGPVIQPLYDELWRRLRAADVTPTGPGLAYYEDAPGERGTERAADPAGAGSGQGDPVLVHAALVITPEALAKAGAGAGRGERAALGFDVVTVPALDRAATVVHRGPMSRILPTVQQLARWIDDNGYRSTGYARELYLECPEDRAEWITEIQEPVIPA